MGNGRCRFGRASIWLVNYTSLEFLSGELLRTAQFSWQRVPSTLCWPIGAEPAHPLSTLGSDDDVELIAAIVRRRKPSRSTIVTGSDVSDNAIEHDVGVTGDRTEIVHETNEKRHLFPTHWSTLAYIDTERNLSPVGNSASSTKTSSRCHF